jgi:hypothetical protein
MKLFSCAITFVGLTLGSLVYAQAPPQGKPPSDERQENANSKVSVTGCLTRGTEANTYQISDQKSGTNLPFNGPGQLDRYVNQTVTLTGTMGSDKVFKPETVKQVAASCEKSQ